MVIIASKISSTDIERETLALSRGGRETSRERKEEGNQEEFRGQTC